MDASSADARLPHVLRLRKARGSQRVTFDDVADHLVDFAAVNPGDLEVVDRLAGFLADVEQVDHDHAAPNGSTASASG